MMFGSIEKSISIRPMARDDSDSVRALCKDLGYPSASNDFEGRLAALRSNPYHEWFALQRWGHVKSSAGSMI